MKRKAIKEKELNLLQKIWIFLWYYVPKTIQSIINTIIMLILLALSSMILLSFCIVGF